MNYFAAIIKRCDEITEIANKYLAQLPFMSNDDVCQRLWDKAKAIDASDIENPDWVESTLDYHIPFGHVPRNGSIYFSLGWSPSMQDARLRNLLEVAEGRETKELALSPLAEKDIVDSYCD